MTNPALLWISEAHQGGYLRAAFIDCQIRELEHLDNEADFKKASELLNHLRTTGISVYHFMYDYFSEMGYTPFLYDSKSKKLIPDAKANFIHVTPNNTEWVYPKRHPNGFTNPFSREVVGNTERTPSPNQKSTLICAGFTAKCCLMETTLGSFAKAANPDKHHVIIALNATNLHPDYYQEYRDDFLAKADEDIKDRIGFATVEQIIAATAPTPSQSSQPRPYRV